jgi:AraC-like DNA-binding protein
VKKRENHIYFHEYPDVEMVFGECSHSFPIHIHENLCIGAITEGCAEFTMSNCKRVLSTGDHYVVPPYTPHTLSSVRLKKFCYAVLCFKNFCIQKRLNDIIESAKAYIETTSPSEFNIDALSKAVHISKYHLDRMFKEQVGVTPYQFYINNRVKKIRQGLHDNFTLSDLVYDLNFTDQSHLCNTFKKHMGVTPMQYASSYNYGIVNPVS